MLLSKVLVVINIMPLFSDSFVCSNNMLDYVVVYPVVTTDNRDNEMVVSANSE